jgi:hypothetical protein
MMKACTIAALLLFGLQMASAEPMKCSGEQKTCLKTCGASAGNAAQAQQCLENCRTAQANCMHNGCWANGSLRYCGLMKQ